MYSITIIQGMTISESNPFLTGFTTALKDNPRRNNQILKCILVSQEYMYSYSLGYEPEEILTKGYQNIQTMFVELTN